MRIIYLVRHGIAVDVGERGVNSDADRMLSPEGRKKTAEAARGLLNAECAPDRIFSSPLIRAAETAEIIAKVIAPRVAIERSELLAPGTPTEETIAWLAGERGEYLMVVGHMPDLASLASTLASGRDTVDIVFRKAGVCCISFDGRIAAGGGCIEWLLQPPHLRLMAHQE